MSLEAARETAQEVDEVHLDNSAPSRTENELPLPPKPTQDESSSPLDGDARDRMSTVLQSDIGISTLLNRLKQSISSARDVASFLKERSSLEEKHAQSLKRLSRSTHEVIRRPESKGGSFASNFEDMTKVHDRMADNGLQYANALYQMQDELQELTSKCERDRKHWKQTGLDAEKRVQDAESAMNKAKGKYNSLADSYDRARTGERQSGKFGIKGGKSSEKQEEDLHRKLEAADGEYASKVQAAQTSRQDLVTTHRPQAVRALQESIMECDAGLTMQLSKYAALSEKMLLGNGLCVSPLRSQAAGASKSLREIAQSVDNQRDFRDYVMSFSAKAGTRQPEIKYEKHPALSPQQQRPNQPPPPQSFDGSQPPYGTPERQTPYGTPERTNTYDSYQQGHRPNHSGQISGVMPYQPTGGAGAPPSQQNQLSPPGPNSNASQAPQLPRIGSFDPGPGAGSDLQSSVTSSIDSRAGPPPNQRPNQFSSDGPGGYGAGPTSSDTSRSYGAGPTTSDRQGGYGGPPQTLDSSRYGGPLSSSDNRFGGPTSTSDTGFGAPPSTSDSRFGGPSSTSDSRVGGPPQSSDSRFGGPSSTSDSRTGGPPQSSDSRFGGAPSTSDSRTGGAPQSSDSRFGGAQSTSDSRTGGPPQTSDSRFGGPPEASDSRSGGPPRPSDSTYDGLPKQSDTFGSGGPTQSSAPRPGFQPDGRGPSAGMLGSAPNSRGPSFGQPHDFSSDGRPPLPSNLKSQGLGAPSGPAPGQPPYRPVSPGGAQGGGYRGMPGPVGAAALPSNQRRQNTGGQNLPPLRPVFGVSLEELFQRDGTAVPGIVYQCVQAVDLFGLDTEGIYRTSGSAPHIMEMKALFDHDSSQVDFRNPSAFHHDIASVTTLLKHFFRDLPDPLLTSAAYSQFIAAAKIDDDHIRRDSLHAIINALPDPNYATLRVVALHLYRVSTHSDKNRMTPSNLAICLGPTIMGQGSPAGSGALGAGGGAQDIKDAGWQARVVETILNNTMQIFDDDE